MRTRALSIAEVTEKAAQASGKTQSKFRLQEKVRYYSVNSLQAFWSLTWEITGLETVSQLH